jgi:hypothetical protein
MVGFPLMFLAEWREFPSAPCLAGEKNFTVRVSILLKWLASPNMLSFILCNKKLLAIRHMNKSLFLDFLIIDNDAPQSVGILWKSDQLVAKTST